ncbi:MAG: SixA phosphatase family protein [Solirubrobacteraceae bacterium]
MADPKRLLLLRHAKSSWKEPSLADHDRPLAPRGRRSAELMSAHLRAELTHIQLVLCSSARRARETLELVAPTGEIQIDRELYGASAADLLERVRDLADQVEVAMLIGHNPAIHELAVNLGGRALADRKFPTGALATLTFPGKWQTLGPGGAELTGFLTPRELGA